MRIFIFSFPRHIQNCMHTPLGIICKLIFDYFSGSQDIIFSWFCSYGFPFLYHESWCFKYDRFSFGHLLCNDCRVCDSPHFSYDCARCIDGCAGTNGECCCLQRDGESGLPCLIVTAFVMLLLFAVFGIFFSVLVATMVGQRIWQRHHHILTKRMLTKVSQYYILFSLVF